MQKMFGARAPVEEQLPSQSEALSPLLKNEEKNEMKSYFFHFA
jgi:hypothetical protein